MSEYSKVETKANIPDKKITIQQNGNEITLSLGDASMVHKFYEDLCTAEFIEENAGLSSEEAYELAVEVRDRMDKHYPELSEEDAIIEVLEEHGYDWNELCNKERDDE